MTNWKSFERRVAKWLGGVRHPVTGERAGADVETDLLVVQCKKGYRLPKYLESWLGSITYWRGEMATGKSPVVVWQAKGARDKDALVVMRLDEFVALVNRRPL